MSKLSRVRTSVAELITFSKEKCTSNIAESFSRGDIKVSDDDLRKIISLVDMSISQAFSLGFSNVESALRDFENSIKK
jgi:hypothetical protein